MNRILVLLLLSIVGRVSYGQQVSVERSYYYLQQAEKDIFELPYENDHILAHIIPEIHSERQLLAPNYPDRSTLPRDLTLVNAAFETWIMDYPNEYQDYLNYLKIYYRTNK